MSETTTEVVVGGIVLAVAIGFLAYAGQFTGLASRQDSYALRASFQSVGGITVGTDVRVAGVKVGSVEEISLNTETYLADTRLGIRREVAVPEDSAAIIAQDGLLGDSYVEIIPGGSEVMLEPGEEIVDTQGAVNLLNLMMKFAGGGTGATAAGQ